MKGGGVFWVVGFTVLLLLSSWLPFGQARIPHFAAIKENLDQLSLSRRSAKEDPPRVKSPVKNGNYQQVSPETPIFSRGRA